MHILSCMRVHMYTYTHTHACSCTHTVLPLSQITTNSILYALKYKFVVIDPYSLGVKQMCDSHGERERERERERDPVSTRERESYSAEGRVVLKGGCLKV